MMNTNIAQMINSKKNRTKGSNVESRCSNKDNNNNASVSNSVLKSNPNI